MTESFRKLFPQKKVIIGMIHLAGQDSRERLSRAISECELYEQEGVHGAIIENYHGHPQDIERVLGETRGRFSSLVLGVNVLGYAKRGFDFTYKYGIPFIQIDSVRPRISLDYDTLRAAHPKAVVLGGVRFKYVRSSGSSLEEDIAIGQSRCDTIVTTGEMTGLPVPIETLRKFRRFMQRDFPLITGSGITTVNVMDQLAIADGAIVGSYFKDDNTQGPIYRDRVREFMSVVNQI
ncbi:MAG: BtpA/SgcQ family protein [Candidatus Pacearchaeota archaeon]